MTSIHPAGRARCLTFDVCLLSDHSRLSRAIGTSELTTYLLSCTLEIEVAYRLRRAAARLGDGLIMLAAHPTRRGASLQLATGKIRMILH